jgi:multidrug resistance efflux pump
MISKLKVYLAALIAFFGTILSANYYRKKSNRLQKQVKAEKAKLHNYQAQLNAAKRHQERYKKEIEDATKDDSYLEYFDRD